MSTRRRNDNRVVDTLRADQVLSMAHVDAVGYSGDDLALREIQERIEENKRQQAALALGSDWTDKFQIHLTGLEIDSDVSEGEWEAFCRLTVGIKRAYIWIIADLAAFGADQWGKKYDVIAGLTGYDVVALTDLAYLARHVHFSVRTEKLSITHHRHVAPLSPDEQASWLSLAATENWNAAQLRAAIDGDNLPTLPGVPGRFGLFVVKNRKKIGTFRRKFKKLSDHERQQVAGMIEEQIADLESLRRELLDLGT